MGPVTLTVADLPRALAFYRERIGLRVHEEDGASARLGAGAGDLLVIQERQDAARAAGAPAGPDNVLRDPLGNAVRLAAR